MGKWEIIRLGDVATYVNGYAFKPSDWGDSGLQIIRIQDLTGNSYTTNYYNGQYKEKYRVKDGDVLISWSASLGIYEWNKGDALLNQHIFKVIFDKIKVDKRYFMFAVHFLLAEMGKETHGSTMKHITKPRFDNTQFPLPPLDEQKRIAKSLDLASEIVKSYKEQLAELDKLVQSVFNEMFGDPVTNEKGWDSAPLSKTARIVTGNTPPRSCKDNYGYHVEWIKTDNITDALYVTQASEYLSERGAAIGRLVDADAILMACIAGSIKSIGRVAIANRVVAFNQQINAVIANKYDTLFLYWLFKMTQEYIQSTINMSLKGILSKGKLEKLVFIVPPISLQTRFASIVTEIEAQKTQVQQALTEAENLFGSLMQEYFE